MSGEEGIGEIGAGGILYRWEEDQQQVAVVRRPATEGHGEDCSLPKGKWNPDRDRTLQDTALREVREETGARSEIQDFAGHVFYKRDDHSKVVLFWRMQTKQFELSGRGPDGERAQWLPVAEAVEALTYDNQKELLRAVEPRPPRSISTKKLKDRSAKRLLAEVAGRRSELEADLARSPIHDSKPRDEARRLLAEAEAMLERDEDVDAAWWKFHVARWHALWANPDRSPRGF